MKLTQKYKALVRMADSYNRLLVVPS